MKPKAKGKKEIEQAAYNPYWKEDRQREIWRERRWKVRMFFLGIFWKVLFFLRINRVVSRMMCRLNVYAKYSMNGRCQWCGEVHGIHWKIKEIDYGGLSDIAKPMNDNKL